MTRRGRRITQSWKRSLAESKRAVRLSVFVLVLFASLTGILSYQFFVGGVVLEVGQVCRQDIRAPKSITYESKILTAQARDQATAAVSDVYNYDRAIADRQVAQASATCKRLTDLRQDDELPVEQQLRLVESWENLTLATSVISDILTVTDVTWYPAVTETVRLTGAVMNQRIRPYSLSEVKSQIPQYVDKSAGFTVMQTRIITSLVPNFIVPNENFDPATTAAARRAARDSVKPVYNTIEQGEIIVRDGEVVTDQVIEELTALDLLQTGVNWPQVGAAALLVALLVTMLAAYMAYFHPALLDTNRHLVLLGLVLLVNAAAAELALPQHIVWAYILYVFPFAAVPMLVAVLLDAQLALFVSVFNGALVGFIANGSLEMATLAALGGAVAVLPVRQARRLNRFVWAGLAAAGVSFAATLVFRVPTRDYGLSTVLALGLASLVSGVLAAILSMGSFYILGSLFDITTTLRLLELANADQPLLKRLLLEAPGTYNHSLLVSNLAERAAEQIGADALLARVGGYYHDIGKVERPYFFVENQAPGQNVHDQLDSITSAKIIIGHVIDGLDLARRHRLPQRIQDFIGQHHGLSLVTYFYRQACNASPT
ncbi:MAG: HDIG domain-containing protein, partial [Chloroflexi bacterium]|nr:HDIG domain-containing protein [Chloroflexota bacterium]